MDPFPVHLTASPWPSGHSMALWCPSPLTIEHTRANSAKVNKTFIFCACLPSVAKLMNIQISTSEIICLISNVTWGHLIYSDGAIFWTNFEFTPMVQWYKLYKFLINLCFVVALHTALTISADQRNIFHCTIYNCFSLILI